MDGPAKSLIGWMAQWGIPSSLHEPNAVSPGKKERKGPRGPLRYFLAYPLPKTQTTVICGPCSALVSQASVTR